MAKMKWDDDGRGVAPGASTNYDGPELVKGSYTLRVKRMTVGKIKAAGENHGKPRLSILLEVVGGKDSNGLHDANYEYLGASVWDGLNVIKSGAGYVNAFLHALTTGSDQAKHEVEAAFWPPNGPDCKKEKNKRGVEFIHVKRIGKYRIGSPNGELLVQAVVKIGKDINTGEPKPEIDRYLPYTGPRPEAPDVEDELDDDMADDDEDLELADPDDGEEFADDVDGDDSPF